MKTCLNTLFVLFALISTKLMGQCSVKNTGVPMDSLDRFIAQKMHESGLVGIGAALIVDKEVVWTKGYGYADKENKLAFTPNTIMNIGSISKIFTGACLMKAVEGGKLSLDEDINAYLPFRVINPNFPDEKITLRQLAAYTSSFADRHPFYTDSTYVAAGKIPESLGSFLKKTILYLLASTTPMIIS